MTRLAYGATISGQDVVLAAVSSNDGTSFEFHPAASAKLRLEYPNDRQAVMAFFNALSGLIKDNGIKIIGILGRTSSGPFASDGVTFKIEGLLQVLDVTEASVVHGKTLTPWRKKYKGIIPAEKFKYQADAIAIGCYALSAKK
jgi:hypothetical protein